MKTNEQTNSTGAKTRAAGFTHLRVRLGVSQEQLAEYLQVSRSLLKMWAGHRRTLPASALIRLGQLEIKIDELEKQKPQAVKRAAPLTQSIDSSLYKECETALMSLKTRESRCRLESNRLSMKLHAMQSEYRQLTDGLVVTMQMIETHAGPPGWWEMRQHTTEAKLEKCSTLAQVLLKLTIVRLDAEAVLNSNAQQDLYNVLPGNFSSHLKQKT